MGSNSYTKYRLQLHMALTTPAVTHTGAGESIEVQVCGSKRTERTAASVSADGQ